MPKKTSQNIHVDDDVQSRAASIRIERSNTEGSHRPSTRAKSATSAAYEDGDGNAASTVSSSTARRHESGSSQRSSTSKKASRSLAASQLGLIAEEENDDDDWVPQPHRSSTIGRSSHRQAPAVTRTVYPDDDVESRSSKTRRISPESGRRRNSSGSAASDTSRVIRRSARGMPSVTSSLKTFSSATTSKSQAQDEWEGTRKMLHTHQISVEDFTNYWNKQRERRRQKYWPVKDDPQGQKKFDEEDHKFAQMIIDVVDEHLASVKTPSSDSGSEDSDKTLTPSAVLARNAQTVPSQRSSANERRKGPWPSPHSHVVPVRTALPSELCSEDPPTVGGGDDEEADQCNEPSNIGGPHDIVPYEAPHPPTHPGVPRGSYGKRPEGGTYHPEGNHNVRPAYGPNLARPYCAGHTVIVNIGVNDTRPPYGPTPYNWSHSSYHHAWCKYLLYQYQRFADIYIG